jgi:hypothetical protein
MSSTIDIMDSMFQEANVISEENASLEKLNILSQQLKKCPKTPVQTKYINLGHKKFNYLIQATRTNHKNKKKSLNKDERKNVIKNLTITQL